MGCTVHKRKRRPGWLLTIHWRNQRKTKTFRTRRQAEATAARIEQVLADADLASVESGTELRELLRQTAPVTAPKRPDVPTLGEFAGQWLADKAGSWSSGTARARETFMRLHIKPEWGSMRLDDIDQPAVRGLLRDKKAEGKSAAFLRSLLATVSGLYRSAMRDYPSLNTNPAHGAAEDIIPPRAKAARPRAWDTDQRGRLLPQIEREPDPNVRELLLFLDATGCRVGEAMALVWENVDTGQGQATIRYSYTKRELGDAKTATSTRNIIVPAATIDRLRALRTHNERQALAAGSAASKSCSRATTSMAALWSGDTEPRSHELAGVPASPV